MTVPADLFKVWDGTGWVLAGPTFAPADLSDLAVWWRADSVSGGVMDDLSGNGNDLPLSGSYSVGGGLVQGGQSSLRFSGGHGYKVLDAQIDLSAFDLWLLTAYNAAPGSNREVTFLSAGQIADHAGPGFMVLDRSTPTVSLYQHGQITTVPRPGAGVAALQHHTGELRNIVTTVGAATDSGVAPTGYASDVDRTGYASDVDRMVCAKTFQNGSLAGSTRIDLFEMAIFNRKLTAPEAAQMNGYFTGRYGL